MLRRTFARPAIALALSLFATANAEAAGQRTFVASTGNDGNPCTLQLPCRSFAPAIALTNAAGEVIVLDSAGYGSLTITKSISIIAPPGVYAGLSPTAGQDGVTITAGVNDKVVLRGLTINGQGGNNGIVVNSGGQVRIEQCTVSNMSADGIRINGGGRIHIRSSIVRSNGGNGLWSGGVGGTQKVHVLGTQFTANVGNGMQVESGALDAQRIAARNNNQGIRLNNPPAGTPVVVTVTDSVVSGNNVGVFASIPTGSVGRIAVVRSTIARNAFSGIGNDALTFPGTTFISVSDSALVENQYGLWVYGAGASAVITRSTLTGNANYEAKQQNLSVLQSTGNNTKAGATDGTITPLAQF